MDSVHNVVKRTAELKAAAMDPRGSIAAALSSAARFNTRCTLSIGEKMPRKDIYSHFDGHC